MFGVFCIYLLRKWIRKKRYVEKVNAWYMKKRSKALRKYDRMVDNIAETSLFLAFILPHMIFFLICVLLRWTVVGGSIIRYFVTETIAVDALSLWWPVIRTVMVLARWKELQNKKKRKEQGLHEEKVDEKKNDKRTGVTAEKKDPAVKVTQQKVSGGIADRIQKLQGASGSSSVAPGKSKTAKPNIPTRHNIKSSQEKDKNEAAVNSRKATTLLKYWIVYSLLMTIIKTLQLFPFIGRVFTAASPPDPYETTEDEMYAYQIWWMNRGFILQECQLLLCVWLWYFQGKFGRSIDSESSPASSDKGSTTRITRKAATSKNRSLYRASPLDLLYQKLAYLVNNTTTNADGTPRWMPKDNKAISSWNVIGKLDSFLQMAVFMKMISTATKVKILQVLSEGTNFLPACVTLLMPSYFTQWGCLYAGCVVPASYGMKSHDAFVRQQIKEAGKHQVPSFRQSEREEKENTGRNDMEQQVFRHLHYWVIYHVVIQVLLAQFLGAVVYWIPFSSHLTLLAIMWLQLLNGAELLYRGIEAELVAFGLLEKDSTSVKHVHGDLNETVTMRVFKKMLSSLPASKDDEEHSNSDMKEGQKADSAEGVSDASDSIQATQFTEKIDTETKNNSLKDKSKSSSGRKEKPSPKVDAKPLAAKLTHTGKPDLSASDQKKEAAPKPDLRTKKVASKDEGKSKTVRKDNPLPKGDANPKDKQAAAEVKNNEGPQIKDETFGLIAKGTNEKGGKPSENSKGLADIDTKAIVESSSALPKNSDEKVCQKNKMENTISKDSIEPVTSKIFDENNTVNDTNAPKKGSQEAEEKR